MSDQMKEAARRFILNIGKPIPPEWLSDDFTAWTGMSGDVPAAVYCERVPMIGEVFPDGLKFEIHDVIAEGKTVALRATSEGTTFDGVPYENDYHFQIKFDDDLRVRHIREYMNVKRAVEVIAAAFAELARRKAEATA